MERTVKCRKLIKDLPILVKGSKEVNITGIEEDSRRIVPGNLFIARRGKTVDGAKMIPHAIANGAVAVLTDMYDPFLPVVQLISQDIVSQIPLLAARFYQNPSEEIEVIGITGTNGKTMTGYLLQHLFTKLGKPCGLMGTIERWIGDVRVPASLTTADVLTNQKYLRDMCNHGLKKAVMEVSSHALAQSRVEGITFDTAVFTNLSQDHLDFHGTMDRYFAAKKKLFTEHARRNAIINRDDPSYVLLQEGLALCTYTYGIKHPADVMAEDVELSLEKSAFTVSFSGQKTRFTLPLIGAFNVYNALAAVATGLLYGENLADMAAAWQDFPGVAGRMQRVQGHVFVDYAHTPDGLEKAIQTLKQIAKDPVIVVFGCGGNRDLEKRPIMAQVAERYADFSIVTSDNPRKEDPKEIAEQIIQGFTKTEHYAVELDRKAAIEKAINLAKTLPQPAVVLIAGKGHEETQEFAHTTTFFNDVEVAREALYHA